MDQHIPQHDLSGNPGADVAPAASPDLNSQIDVPAGRESGGVPSALPGSAESEVVHPDITAPPLRGAEPDRGVGRLVLAAESGSGDRDQVTARIPDEAGGAADGSGTEPEGSPGAAEPAGPEPAAADVTADEGHEAAHDGGRGRYFDEFIAEHTAEITDKLDGPEGFFAQAREQGFGERVTPETAAAIEGADDAVLGRLGVTKEELRLIAGAYGGGQERTSLTEVKTPGELTTSEDGVAHTDVGDIPLDRNPETGEHAVPRGCFVKSRGELWAVAPELESRYPDPAQRRIASAWSFAHEYAHGVTGRDLMNVLTETPGQPITLADGTPTDTTTQLEQTLASMPAEPLTDYSGSYRQADGTLPSREEAPIAHIRAVEEELCERAAANVLGFAPTPGRPADVALNNPQQGSEEFHRRTWDYMTATPRR
jgi:hypothetical protein